MGPWTHNLGDNHPGEMIFPTNAKSDPWSSKIFEAMFAERLLGLTQYGNYRTMPNVTYYIMGDLSQSSLTWNTWATAADWPIAHTNRTLYFQSDETMSTSVTSSARNYTFIFDPHNPLSTVGGANLDSDNRGPYMQNTVESGRTDLLQFNYAITDPFLVTGRIWAHLYVTSNCTDTDFTAKLMDVYPNGMAYLLNDGIIRMRYRNGLNTAQFMDGSNKTVYDAWVDLWSTSYVLNSGHTLRISISSSNYPRFDVNPNTGAIITPVNAATSMYTAQNSLIVSSSYQSAIFLPIPTTIPNFIG
jgi:putative CocE/NonD family hydrolase